MFSIVPVVVHPTSLFLEREARCTDHQMPLRGDVIAMEVGDPFDEGMRAIPTADLAGDAAGDTRDLQSAPRTRRRSSCRKPVGHQEDRG